MFQFFRWIQHLVSYVPWSPEDGDDEWREDELSEPEVDDHAEEEGSGLERGNIEDPFQIFSHDPFEIIFWDLLIRVTHFKGSFSAILKIVHLYSKLLFLFCTSKVKKKVVYFSQIWELLFLWELDIKFLGTRKKYRELNFLPLKLWLKYCTKNNVEVLFVTTLLSGLFDEAQ